MQLFASVKWGLNLDRQVNFRSFSNSFLLLFQVLTGTPPTSLTTFPPSHSLSTTPQSQNLAPVSGLVQGGGTGWQLPVLICLLMCHLHPPVHTPLPAPVHSTTHLLCRIGMCGSSLDGKVYTSTPSPQTRAASSLIELLLCGGTTKLALQRRTGDTPWMTSSSKPPSARCTPQGTP